MRVETPHRGGAFALRERSEMAEGLIEKLEERIAKVREAFSAAYPAPQPQMAQGSEWWVVEVFDD